MRERGRESQIGMEGENEWWWRHGRGREDKRISHIEKENLLNCVYACVYFCLCVCERTVYLAASD